MNNNQSSRAPFPKWLLAVAIGVLLATFIVPHINFTALSDWFRTIGYEPSAEVVALEDKVALTDEGKHIFLATHPALESNEDFNYHCASYNHDISILGCYSSGQIYIYNVESNELSGIKESTAAHELLHAAWDRLSASEQKKLTPLLNQVYNDNHDALADDLTNYAEADQLDELHSRIGTQIANLPEELETHYARYFRDQDAVVRFYTQYQTPFNELRQQLNALSSELESLKQQIDAKTTEYENRLKQLSSDIDEFNICADTAGCFTTATFNSKRAELVAEQTAVKNFYSELENLTNTYNQKVKQYNQNILRTQTLQNSINSNSTPPTI